MATKCVVNKSTLTDIATAIRTKGGTTDTLLPSEMPSAIAAIPSGGDEWGFVGPNAQSILSDYDDPSFGHAIILILTNHESYSPNLGGSKYRFSDNPGVLYDSYSHTWDDSKDIDESFRWVIAYSTTVLALSLNNNSSHQHTILGIAAKTGTSIFIDAYNIRTNQSLQYILGENINFIIGGTQFMFNCYACSRFPRNWMLNALSNNAFTLMFVSCGFLITEFPSRIAAPASGGAVVSFENFILGDPDILAVFDNEDSITGGLAYGDNITTINDGVSSSISFPPIVKNRMNLGTVGAVPRWNKFVDSLNAKNWTVSPAKD